MRAGNPGSHFSFMQKLPHAFFVVAAAVSAYAVYVAGWKDDSFWPAVWLTLTAGVYAGVGALFRHSARRTEGTPRWRLGVPPPSMAHGTKVHRHPRQVVKANLFWASLGLLGVLPNFLYEIEAWQWVISGALSALYSGLLCILAWHNSTYGVWLGREAVIAQSALGHQAVPFTAVREIVAHTWRDQAKRRDVTGSYYKSFNTVVSRSFRFKDGEGHLIVSIPRELVPPVTELIEVVVKRTGLKVGEETLQTSTYVN